MNKRKFLAGLTVIVISLLALMGCKGAVEPSLSNDSSLVSLTVTGAIISPVFSASVTAYTATVPYTTTGVTVSASAASTASVAIKGSSSPKLVPLNVGSNIINVVVTAEDGSTKTYTVTITREAGSSSADLATLEVTGATLSPAFSSSTVAYTATVPYATASATVTATVAQPSSSVKINGSNSPKEVSLSVGANIINVVVTAEDASTKTYTVTITREAANADLASLSISGTTLNQAFAPNTTYYTANVLYAVKSITINATMAQATSSVLINDYPSSQPVNLSVGANTIKIVVTDQSGKTKTYTISVTRGSANADASLGNLELSAGRLLFSPSVTNYTVGVAQAAAEITVNAQPSSGVASMTINGVDTISAIVPLPTASTVIEIKVTAESGAVKTYTVQVNKAATSTVPVNFLVVESINGSVLPGSVITVFDADMKPITATATSDTYGSATISLPPDAVYSFFSDKAGYAQNCYQSFYVSTVGEMSVVMVNQRLGMSNRVASAPEILGVGLSHVWGFSDFTPYAGEPINTYGETYLIATFISTEAVAPTAWSGFGAKLDVNRTPTTFNGVVGIPLGEPYTNAQFPNKYLADFCFDISGLTMPAGYQNVVIVGYDVANNRVELSSPVSFTKNPTGSSIDTCKFKDLNIGLSIYPVSLGFFGKKPGSNIMALNQYAGKDISYRAQLTFKFDTQSNTEKLISGFHVYRSTDNTTFSKIGSQFYPAPTGGVHSYFDADSQLAQGTIYYYKVVAFTDATYTKESGVVQSYLSPPFTANLTTPLNRATMNIAAPHDYSFSVTDTTLWDSDKSDFFYFALTLKEKTGAWKFVGQFRYNFSSSRFEVSYGNNGYNSIDVLKAHNALSSGTEADYLTYNAGVITINDLMLVEGYNYAGSFEYQSGVAYQWDISGDVAAIGGAGQPCWFEKSTVGGTSRSYGNGYSEGGNAVNGLFEFSVVE